MDRGMSSAENVEWLQETGRRYLIGAPKSELKKWSREIADGRDWQTVRDGVEAKLCRGPDGTETFLLCRSADRREKERAMHERFSKRIEERLASLGRRLARSRQKLDREAIGRQIGRMLAQNSRAAGRYQIHVVDDPTQTSGLRLDWKALPEWDAWAIHSEGAYVLRTNIHDWSEEDLWRTYIQLTEAEGGLPDPQERPVDSPRLASEGRARAGPHPGLLPGLRAVEDAGTVAATSRAREQPAHDPRGNRPDPEHRRGCSRSRTRRDVSCGSAAWCGPTRRRRCCSIASVYDSPNDSARPHMSPKCSANSDP